MKTLDSYIEEGILNRDVKTALGEIRLDAFYKYSKNLDASRLDCFWMGLKNGNTVVPGRDGIEIIFKDRKNSILKLLDLPAGPCPEFNITKVINKTHDDSFFLEVSGPVTDLSGLFSPNCKFDGEFQLELSGLGRLKDLSSLPRMMKGVYITTVIGPSVCTEATTKTDYKDMDEFLEPYKKFIDSVPKNSGLDIYIHFGDIYGAIKRRIKIGGERVVIGNLRKDVRDFCESYYEDKFNNDCTVYTIG